MTMQKCPNTALHAIKPKIRVYIFKEFVAPTMHILMIIVNFSQNITDTWQISFLSVYGMAAHSPALKTVHLFCWPNKRDKNAIYFSRTICTKDNLLTLTVLSIQYLQSTYWMKLGYYCQGRLALEIFLTDMILPLTLITDGCGCEQIM